MPERTLEIIETFKLTLNVSANAIKLNGFVLML